VFHGKWQQDFSFIHSHDMIKQLILPFITASIAVVVVVVAVSFAANLRPISRVSCRDMQQQEKKNATN
jgi:hypothetical protein